jgi:hypothetical protein
MFCLTGAVRVIDFRLVSKWTSKEERPVERPVKAFAVKMRSDVCKSLESAK